MGEVIASYNRIRHQDLAEKFYKRLLAADLRIQQAFSHTDFEQQRKLFTHGLLMLLQFGNDKTVGKIAIRRLSESHGHAGMNIAPELYPVWIKCLLATVAELDPEYSPELEKKWHLNLKKGITELASMHCPHMAAQQA